jgi:hypothetical protein
MRETIGYIWHSWDVFLVGGGPSSIIDMYSSHRSEVIERYFPRDMIIDSSHNLWLDIWAKYGIISLFGLYWFILKRWKNISPLDRESLILGGIFLSFNVAVISHYIFLVLLLYSRKSTVKKS